ncbi:MAG: DUF5009 domain-containing protein [Thermoguttaceae bacterium]|nr:DUF5009 domain-containing protein [Thermoguttaceae bacterium]
MSAPEVTQAAPKKRLVSLDAMRGANMFFIMGGSGLIALIMTTFWPDAPWAQWIAGQMDHVDWHGFAHHDSIFPTFLFIAGCAFPFSYASQVARGRSKARITAKVILRGLILVLLGILYNNGIHFDFAHFRYASVLGHIGLGWMFAALLYLAFGGEKGAGARWFFLILILVGYWMMLRFIPVPGHEGADPFSMEGSLVSYIDQKYLPGVLHQGIFDPEGILSTIPAVATALLGIFTGEWLRKNGTDQDGWNKFVKLVVFGVVLVILGLVWDKSFPINKKLWTSSFVCFVAGCDMIVLAIFYAVIDVIGWRCWAFPFVVIGMNSITIYLAQQFINFSYTRDYFFKSVIALASEKWQPILTSCAGIFVLWFFLYMLYRYKAFFKV